MSNILVTRSSMPSFEEYCEEIKEIWNSHWLTNMGVKHKELQKELENYLGISHVVLYTNGHLALENAIAALNLPKGGEVITTPFTFASTTHAIVRNGLIPVFCDIKEDDYTIDTQKLENLITDNTVAIVPVHVYGNICDVEEIDRISKKYGLKVIYDAAHAFAVKYKGESSACFGDASMFSFHAKYSVGLTVDEITQKPYDGCWAEIILHSDEPGVFKELWISDEIADNVVERDLWIEEGTPVGGFEAANEAIGTLVLKFDSQERIEEVLGNQSKYVKVELMQ